MFDLLLAVALARAVVMSIVRRSLACTILGALAVVAWMWLIQAGWFDRGGDGLQANGAWMLLFLGPSGLAARHAIHVRLGMTALLLGGLGVVAHGARAYSPLSDRSAELRRLGGMFLLPAVLVMNEVLALLAVEAAGRAPTIPGVPGS